MALDFPSNPVNGEVFGSYVWNASVGVWQGREESATVAVVSPTTPLTANNGDIWYNSSFVFLTFLLVGRLPPRLMNCFSLFF